jgi:putative membrane-bound dehydrogenase-like protein
MDRPRSVLRFLPCLAAILAAAACRCVGAADPPPAPVETGLRAGAAAVNITPPLGEPIVGGFHPYPATHVHDELHARCLVLDDGTTRLALVVCDLLGVHRSVSDEARRLIAAETGIPPEHVLISATHTHSATTALGGTGDERFKPTLDQLTPYQAFVVRRIADGVRRAANLLRPAELAVGTVDAPEHVFNRRWFMRPGTMPENPFGSADDLVKMNPPAGSPNLDRPAGPTDPTISIIAVREPDGRPISVYAAYSLHYVGGVGPGHVSADYFAIVCDELARLSGGDRADPPFVALLANGTSGDINNINFRTPRPAQPPYVQMRAVATDVAAKIHGALPGLAYTRSVPLAARYRELELGARHPTDKEAAWSAKTLETPTADDAKKSLSEIYAERVRALAKQPPTVAVPLQVLKVGPARIGAMPCEVFCEIGLDFRRRSGGSPGFLVSIAHGYMGYLPTPRQHDLGGYETWPGTNRLERDASDKMLAALVEMCGELSAVGGAPSPAESLARLEVDPGLRVELVAAEPDVVDPVALTFDEHGRMWVAEMRDYPTGPADGGPPLSRIKVLEDRDGDGRYEHATLFAEGLSFANGLQPWRGGVIVTCAGRVAWLADTDGDGRADRDDTLFTGFAEQNSQLRANHPTLGIDGLVYVANGLRGGEVVAADPRWRRDDGARRDERPAPLDIRGRDFRLDPRCIGGDVAGHATGTYATVTGHGQFGLAFDDFGTRFICSNRNPCVQVMLEERDLVRNPALALASAVQDAAPAGEQSRIHPLSAAWTTSNLHAGQFTAACGVRIERGDALPDSYRGDAFTCDPTGNLVHRSRLEREGVAYASVPDEPGAAPREFLASPSDFFRPVGLATGPDGCLYVADMCRAVIEHPDFMPDELKTRPDLRHGDDRGRIWRVVPADASRRAAPPRLAERSSAELVAVLDHPNGWHRDTAARLLLERGDATVADGLRRHAVSGGIPAGRAQALHLLERLGALDDATLVSVLADGDGDVRLRATALRLSGPRLVTAGPLREGVLAAAADPAPLVRFEAALRLGEMPADAAGEAAIVRALADIACATPLDRWTRAAVGTAVRGRAAAVLVAVLDRHAPAPHADVAGDLAELAANGGEPLGEALAAVARLRSGVADRGRDAVDDVDDMAIAMVDGIGRGLERRRVALAAVRGDMDPAAVASLSAIFDTAVARATDVGRDATERSRAIRVLRHAGFAGAGSRLVPLAAAGTDQEVRLAAIATVSRWTDPSIDDALLADVASQTPAIRRAVLDVSCGQPSRAARLLEAIDSGSLAATLLTPDHWKRLAGLADAALTGRAAALQAASQPADRQEVVARYRAALEQAGNVGRGRLVFTKHCAGCHRIGDVGVNVGPDISDSRTQKPEQYLVHILDPNRVIDANFFAYTVVLADGRALTGLVVSEAGGAVTLRQQDGKEVTLGRDEIETISNSGVSLMPVGMERAITVPEMADLIAFIKGWRYGGDGLPPPAATARLQP